MTDRIILYAHANENSIDIRTVSARMKSPQGDRPVMFPYQYHFEADTCGHVYCENLPKARSGSSTSITMSRCR